MRDKVKLICKINCLDDMSKIFDTVAKFVVDRVCEEADKFHLSEETRKELLCELIDGIMEGKIE